MFKLGLIGLILSVIGIFSAIYSLSVMQSVLVIQLSVVSLVFGISALYLEIKRQEYYKNYEKEQA